MTGDRLAAWVDAHRAEVRDRLLGWWEGSRRDYPWREPGLPAYGVLLAEVLLKRTTATAAARAFKAVYGEYPDVWALASAPVDRLEAALKCVGLQRQRAAALKEVASYICGRAGGEVPRDLGGLLAVPHVGPYTARAVLCFAYGEPVGVVDSNVTRVIGRLCRAVLPPAPRAAVYQAVADRLTPARGCREFNWALLDFGALVCRYARALCSECPLRGLCTATAVG